MTEAQVLDLYSQIADRQLVIVQWWVSTTIGLVALSHFAGKRLNTFLVTFVLFAYVTYTIFASLMFYENGLQQLAYVGSLQWLQLGGVELSPAGRQIVDAEGVSGRFAIFAGSFLIAVFSAFIGAIGYVIYSYRKARASENRAS